MKPLKQLGVWWRDLGRAAEQDPRPLWQGAREDYRNLFAEMRRDWQTRFGTRIAAEYRPYGDGVTTCPNCGADLADADPADVVTATWTPPGSMTAQRVSACRAWCFAQMARDGWHPSTRLEKYRLQGDQERYGHRAAEDVNG